MKKILNFIGIFQKVGEQIFLKTATLMLAGIVIIISAGVVKRYVLDSPILWTEEICTFLFVWVAFLGAGVAASRKKHIRVDIFTAKLSDRNQKILEFGTQLLILVFLVIIVIGGIQLQPVTSRSASVALDIPKNYYYLPVVISCAYMLVLCVGSILEKLENFLPQQKQ